MHSKLVITLVLLCAAFNAVQVQAGDCRRCSLPASQGGCACNADCICFGPTTRYLLDACAKCNGPGGCKCDSNCNCIDKCAKCNGPGGCKCDSNCDCKPNQPLAPQQQQQQGPVATCFSPTSCGGVSSLGKADTTAGPGYRIQLVVTATQVKIGPLRDPSSLKKDIMFDTGNAEFDSLPPDTKVIFPPLNMKFTLRQILDEQCTDAGCNEGPFPLGKGVQVSFMEVSFVDATLGRVARSALENAAQAAWEFQQKKSMPAAIKVVVSYPKTSAISATLKMKLIADAPGGQVCQPGSSAAAGILGAMVGLVEPVAGAVLGVVSAVCSL